MRLPILIIIALIVVNFFVDLYIYAAIHSYTRKKIWNRIHVSLSAIWFALIVACLCVPRKTASDTTIVALMWGLFAYFSFYIPKYLFILFDALSRLPMLWRRKRWTWLSWAGVAAGLCVLCLMWWGALYNRFQIHVNNVEVEIANLDASFDGLRFAQISDLHVGSFGKDTCFVTKLVEEVNALHPDAIVFTGDIVNRHSEELKQFIPVLSRLKAPLGVYSIMGNHDYGDYSQWESDDAKLSDVNALKSMQRSMGWRMLNNDHCALKRDSAEFIIIGVENVGDPPFKTYGNLSQAYPSIGDGLPKILLTHNPIHWTNDIADNPNSNIALTLSGHTHAMQIEAFGFSPSMWRYPTWGGLYTDSKGQKLYVNIGAGEVGIPARIGANPEITIFTIKSKK